MSANKKPKKEKLVNHTIPQNGPNDDVFELKVYINEKYKSKVVSDKIINTIKEVIPFQMYHVSKSLIKLTGSDLASIRGVAYILESLYGSYKKLKNPENEYLIFDELETLIDEVVKETGEYNYIADPNAIIKTHNGVYISPRTENQELFVDSMRSNVITICRGVAGTGKSALAIAVAVSYLLENRFDKLLLVRPLTTVGGKDMGFLPGTLEEKYGPYASPLVQTIVDLIGENKYNEWIKAKKIIPTPTAFVRGDNFKDAIVVIDEAQNLSESEIFTLLTRICHNSKVVITGDESQDDRKDKFKNDSGLSIICDKLRDIDKIGIVTMAISDIQRHGIVKNIIEAFE